LQGKCVINSINLEDGEERFVKVAPLLQRYGGAVVVGCIDEDPKNGMAVTRSANWRWHNAHTTCWSTSMACGLKT